MKNKNLQKFIIKQIEKEFNEAKEDLREYFKSVDYPILQDMEIKQDIMKDHLINFIETL